MRSLERVNIRTNVRTYSHTYVRDRPYIPSTTLLCEGIINKVARAMTKGKHICCLRGHNSANNDLDQNSTSFMHMSNAYLNCVASFQSLHQIL